MLAIVLLQNYLAFLFKLLGVQAGMHHNVGEHVQANVHVLTAHSEVVVSKILRCTGIPHSAYAFNNAVNLARAAWLCSFEKHVFEEVRYAINFPRLIDRAGIDPDVERDNRRCVVFVNENC